MGSAVVHPGRSNPPGPSHPIPTWYSLSTYVSGMACTVMLIFYKGFDTQSNKRQFNGNDILQIKTLNKEFDKKY